MDWQKDSFIGHMASV